MAMLVCPIAISRTVSAAEDEPVHADTLFADLASFDPSFPSRFRRCIHEDYWMYARCELEQRPVGASYRVHSTQGWHYYMVRKDANTFLRITYWKDQLICVD